MGCEIGRIRPTNVFERAGESRMTPPASSISSQVRPGSGAQRLASRGPVTISATTPCDGVVVLGGAHCLDAPPERPARRGVVA